MNIAAFRWITLVTVLFWLIFYWQGGKKVIVDIQESIHARKSRLDTVLLAIMAFCSMFLIGMGVLSALGRLSGSLLQDPVLVLCGTVFVILGILGMFYCRHYLGRFWTAETNLARDHQIIDTGPYGLVRHPIYTFAILMYTGLGLVFLSYWSALLAGVIVVSYGLKTLDEDMFLEKNLFGYRDYQSRVRYRLVPRVW